MSSVSRYFIDYLRKEKTCEVTETVQMKTPKYAGDGFYKDKHDWCSINRCNRQKWLQGFARWLMGELLEQIYMSQSLPRFLTVHLSTGQNSYLLKSEPEKCGPV